MKENKTVTNHRFYEAGASEFSHPLQQMVQLHGFQKVVLLGPEIGAQSLADCSELTALRLNGVLGIVGVLDKLIAFTRQCRGSFQSLLQSSIELSTDVSTNGSI